MASIVKHELHAVTTAPSPARLEDTVMLLRGGRGRSRRMRVISNTKLPRMNNSERGKFYRQKYREYEGQLEQDVERLQGEVHELQRLLTLRQALPHQYPCVGLDEVQAATQVVYDGLLRLWEQWAAMDGSAGLLTCQSIGKTQAAESVNTVNRLQVSPSPSERFIARHQNSSTPLVFKLESVKVEGCSDSRVVVAHGHLFVQYLPSDIETIFLFVRHNQHLASRLLAREVAFDCTYRFHSTSLCGQSELAFVSVDVDAVGGLLVAIPSPYYVEALLGTMDHSDHSGMKVEKATVGSRTSSTNCYTHSPVLLATAIHAVNGQDYLPPPAPLRPMALAFILS